MRQARRIQLPLTEPWLDLERAQELEAISRLLDQHPTVNDLVLQDLRTPAGAGRRPVGAGGLSAEQVLRALLLKQMGSYSYRELAFHLADSRSYRTFCRIGVGEAAPSKSALAANLKTLRVETLEAINRVMVRAALEAGVEDGRRARVDCTVVESNIHEPTDSGLLWDGVRKLTTLMSQARELLGVTLVNFSSHRRRAKRRHKEISTAKSNEQRQDGYRDLIRVTEQVQGDARRVLEVLQEQLKSRDFDPLKALALKGIAQELEHFLPLTRQVIEQTRRRVLEGETVPAGEKIVSIFEEHTDIIRKDRRETLYGHKICLTAGASSMILDCKVLEGNPADSTLAETMVDRQREIFARFPRQVTFDGCFASKPNLRAIKAKQGVEDVVFSKGRGLAISDMARSSWVYRRLWRFRAGVEGLISFLKRIFGLDRCTWRSWPSFQSYVWGSILACNLLVMARHLLA
jgi:IS5 family transposase